MLSATAIANFLTCQHLTALDRAEAAGDLKKDFFPDPGLELLIRLGLEHEQAYLKGLREEGFGIVEIPSETSRADAVAATIAALHAGVDVVYQPVFLDGDSYGRADFLKRVDKPSKLGNWSYEVFEAKLARSTKVRAVIQLCHYSLLLSKIQGADPDWMHVVLGGGALPEKFLTSHYLAYFRKIKREYEEASAWSKSTYPEPNEHCRVCDWYGQCDRQWRDDDSLTLVANISRNQRKALGEREISTLTALAELTLPVTPKIERIGKQALLNIREQARVQLKGRNLKQPIYEFLEPKPERGLSRLPLPSAADIFLDFESAPFAFGDGLEYLFGVITVSGEPSLEPIYEATWALNRAEEKKAFEKFMTWVMERWAATPEMHIYHYAPYEQTAIKRLAGRHSCFVDELDRLLRGGVFVDLLQVVRQGLRASVESYSIKKLEPFYSFTRDRALPEATRALESLETFFSLGETKADLGVIRDTVEEYNRDDCVSALRLREWLEGLRIEVETQTGISVPRPAPKESAPSEKLAAEAEEVVLLTRRLLTNIPEDKTERTTEQQAQWLLANLLDWNRREEKSSYWEYFRLCDLSDAELQEDKTALGGLEYMGAVGEVKRSAVHRYQFPPQTHAIDRARTVIDPSTKNGAGTVVLPIDDLNGLIDISRGVNSKAPHPSALIPKNIVPAPEVRESLLRLGDWVADNGITTPGSFQAARDLLLRRPPTLKDETIESARLKSESLTEAGKLLALVLENSTLPIQGPPGSGKTYIGARMILELVQNRRRVGITATSHKVICNLLKEVCKAARKSEFLIGIIQKVTDKVDGFKDQMVTVTTKNEDVPAALASGDAQVAAGTAWLWAREEMANSVDVLFVDEAGQVSLAYALAASQGAGSLVLLGDPQQLDQPVKGVHPPGTDISALAHLLNGQTTIGDEQGLFLDETWRLHPDVCDFTSEVFYEGRLVSREENQSQRIHAEAPLGGTGLRFAPTRHSGNQNESPEEVVRVNALVRGLLDNNPTWTDRDGVTKPVTIEDILVVAPYNAQVSALRKALPDEVRVGTVDKFQGQEAPVVIYSMATSTPEDAPRGMEFLYSSNRLNVATSRAQCVTVLVASPALFQVQCKTPRQMELANAFCRYLEMARSI
ncbi:MAG TPA: TM0106 family RecB-like putative nuclease [Pyrinomonadaceae bacterium]|nr:TM0106 family RecB-like putative nuclease [Pyrinomonadaceae bacterium]